ncbi:MAG: CapA family protein [Deltaproteobacteria bacterium]|nr:CapA family protein [Deltaproteobacteria bacterium]
MREERAAAAVAVLLALGLGALPFGARRRAPSPSPVLWFGGDVHYGDEEGPLFTGPLPPGPWVVNLEGPLDASPGGSSSERLRNHPRGLHRLREAGVVAVSIANNHAGDNGPAGALETARAARSVGLVPFGLEAGVGLLSVRGHTVSLASFDLRRGVPEELPSTVQAMPGTAVVALHDTAPARYLPSPTLREAARVALASGARVVVSHGTHSVAPVERRGGAVVAFGLGNLRFACGCSRDDEGMALGVRLGRPSRAWVLPVDAGLGAEPARLARDPEAFFALLRALGRPVPHRGGVGFF